MYLFQAQSQSFEYNIESHFLDFDGSILTKAFKVGLEHCFSFGSKQCIFNDFEMEFWKMSIFCKFWPQIPIFMTI